MKRVAITLEENRVVALCPHCRRAVMRRSGDGVQVAGSGVVLKGGEIGANCKECGNPWTYPVSALDSKSRAG